MNLIKCQSHQAYYTALSHSATAAGILIIWEFDANKIQGKASRALCREFCELELLDEITKLRYMNQLLNSFVDLLKWTNLISSFRQCKQKGYMSSNLYIKADRPYLTFQPAQHATPGNPHLYLFSCLINTSTQHHPWSTLGPVSIHSYTTHGLQPTLLAPHLYLDYMPHRTDNTWCCFEPHLMGLELNYHRYLTHSQSLITVVLILP